MSVQHQRIITDTKKPGPAHEAHVFTSLPGIIVDTKGNDTKPASDSDEVNRLILNRKTPGAGNQNATMKPPELPKLPNKAPATKPKSTGQIPYAGRMY